MSDVISYEGLDEAELVHALYHGTQPLGMGWLHNKPTLSVDEVRSTLAEHPPDNGRRYFDYYAGRPLKVILDTNAKTFGGRLYDRDAGDGAAAAIVDSLRRKAGIS